MHNLKPYFWKFVHNALVHPLMAWPYEPQWMQRLHNWTAKKMEPQRPANAEQALREIAALIDVSTISTNAHDWAMTLTQIREIVNQAMDDEGAIHL